MNRDYCEWCKFNKVMPRKKTKYMCDGCNAVLCIGCFKEYHMKEKHTFQIDNN